MMAEARTGARAFPGGWPLTASVGEILGRAKAFIAHPGAARALRLQKLDDLQARLDEGLLRVAPLDGERRRLHGRTPFLFRRELWLSERNFPAPRSGLGNPGGERIPAARRWRGDSCDQMAQAFIREEQ